MALPHSLDWLAPSVSTWDAARQRHAREGHNGLFKQIRLEVAAVSALVVSRAAASVCALLEAPKRTRN
jgi:hypothetical protein